MSLEKQVSLDIFDMLENSKCGNFAKYFGEEANGWFANGATDDIIDVLETPFYLNCITEAFLSYANESLLRMEFIHEAMKDVLCESLDAIVASAETKDWLYELN